MQSRPTDLADDALVNALAAGWDLDVRSLRYRPVGFGSHHWSLRDTSGTEWFVTVDAVGNDPGPLHAALSAAVDLRAAGCTFVVAPVPTAAGEPLAFVDRYAVAVYPQVDGEHHPHSEFADEAHRRALLDVVVRLHATPLHAVPTARRDDFAIAHRGEVAAGTSGRGPRGTGPYAARTAALLEEQAAAIRTAFADYDVLVAHVRAEQRPAVITHGEPHPANTITTPAGLMLVDWDTVLVAAPERDLWSLDAGDGRLLRAYTDVTGTELSADALSLYRLRWDLRDIAEYVNRFGRRHDGNADDEKSWNGLRATVLRRRDD